MGRKAAWVGPWGRQPLMIYPPQIPSMVACSWCLESLVSPKFSNVLTCVAPSSFLSMFMCGVLQVCVVLHECTVIHMLIRYSTYRSMHQMRHIRNTARMCNTTTHMLIRCSTHRLVDHKRHIRSTAHNVIPHTHAQSQAPLSRTNSQMNSMSASC